MTPNRSQELQHYTAEIEWADKESALAIYKRVVDYGSRSHYGLDSRKCSDIQRIKAVANDIRTQNWLLTKIQSPQLSIIYSRLEVAKISCDFFIANWQDIFMPSRDDAYIVPTNEKWLMFYCHEDEFEYGLVND